MGCQKVHSEYGKTKYVKQVCLCYWQASSPCLWWTFLSEFLGALIDVCQIGFIMITSDHLECASTAIKNTVHEWPIKVNTTTW